MADKMMRIAGRGEDGSAKAINTDNAGNVRISQLSATKRIRHSDILAPGSTIQLINTDKEIILHSLVCQYTHDSISQDVMRVWFGKDLYTPIMKSLEGGFSGFIIPSLCIYDGVFQVLVNEPGQRFVALKREIRTKGLSIELQNRNTEYYYPFHLIAFYSEVE